MAFGCIQFTRIKGAMKKAGGLNPNPHMKKVFRNFQVSPVSLTKSVTYFLCPPNPDNTEVLAGSQTRKIFPEGPLVPKPKRKKVILTKHRQLLNK
jgi:hypothetical protein